MMLVDSVRCTENIPHRWTWSCPDMQTYMRQHADTSLLDGWLQLISGTTAESSTSYRVPGTAYKYRWRVRQSALCSCQ